MIRNTIFAVIGVLLALLILFTSGFTTEISILGRSLQTLWFFLGLIFLIIVFFLFTFRESLLIFFIISIFFWVDKNFLFRPNHAGGAFGLSLGITDFLIFIFFIFYFFKVLQGKYDTFDFVPKITIPFLFLVGISTLSLFNSINLTLSTLEIIRMMKGLFVFLFVVNVIRNTHDIKFVSLCLITMFFMESFIALIQLAFKGTLGFRFIGEEEEIYKEQLLSGAELIRVSGTFGNPHSLATVFGFLIPLIFGLSLIQNTPVRRWIYLSGVLLGICTLIATFSRTILITLTLSMTAVLFLSVKRRLWNNKNKNMIVIMLCVIVIAVSPLIPSLYNRLLYTDPGSVGIRTDLNRVSISMLKEHLVLGIGINTYTEFVEAVGDPLRTSERMPFGEAVDHNIYFLIAAETGILGLFAFILLLYKIFKQAVECYTSKNILLSVFGLGIIGGYINFFVRGFISFEYRLDQIFIFFWFMAGFTAAIRRLGSSPSNPLNRHE